MSIIISSPGLSVTRFFSFVLLLNEEIVYLLSTLMGKWFRRRKSSTAVFASPNEVNVTPAKQLRTKAIHHCIFTRQAPQATFLDIKPWICVLEVGPLSTELVSSNIAKQSAVQFFVQMWHDPLHVVYRRYQRHTSPCVHRGSDHNSKSPHVGSAQAQTYK